MNKVIMLNSGGYDSVILLHELISRGNHVRCIFFNYGQRNYVQERNCMDTACRKINVMNKKLIAEFMEIELPTLFWAKTTLYDSHISPDDKDQYIPMRNLIFLSYAVSVAESLGVSEIYTAIIAQNIGFTDTSIEFVDTLNKVAMMAGVQILAPYAALNKYDLMQKAIEFGLHEDDVFSCNTPIEGKPCGKCGDCETLKTIFNPQYEWCLGDTLGYTDEFAKSYMKEPVTELRFLINNRCQFECTHCYHTEKLVTAEMSYFEKCNALSRTIRELDIEHVHFAGKEPMFDYTIFDYVKYLKFNFPDVTYDVVTNGVNVVRYIEDIKTAGFEKIVLSVDNLNEVEVRPEEIKYTTFHALEQNKIPMEIHISVHKGNYKSVYNIVSTLHLHFGVTKFFIKPVIPVGKAKNLDSILTAREYDDVFKSLYYEFKNLEITFHSPNVWTSKFLRGDYYITPFVNDVINTGLNSVNGMILTFEFFCNRGQWQVTLTPDGYLLGCALEISQEKYNLGAITDVKRKELDLTECVKRYRENRLKQINRLNLCSGNIPSCYFCEYDIES